MRFKKKDVSSISTIIYTIKTMYRMDKPYLLLLCLSMITMSVLPFLHANLVSHVINLVAAGTGMGQVGLRIFLILGGIVLLESVDAFVRWHRTNHYISLGHQFDVIVAQKTLSLRYEYAESPEVANLRMKANRAGSSVPVSAEATIELGANLIKTLGCATVFAALGPLLLVMVVAFTALNYAVSRHFQKKTYENEQREYPYRRKAEYFLSEMLDHVSGKEIRIFSASGLIREKYEEAQEGIYRTQKQTRRMQLGEQIVGLLITVIQLAVIYFVTGRAYFAGGARIGDVIFYVNLILVFSASFQGIFYRLLDIDDRGRRIQDFREYMGLEEEETEKETVRVDEAHVTIELEHVWFRYPESGEDILKDVSFSFDERSSYAIVGENGCGKSTLIKLLMRFYLPTRGRILVNGVDYTTIDREQYYRLFTTVFQDFKLTAYSIAENIDFATKERDREKIAKVLERQGILEKVESLAEGMDSCLSQEFSAKGVNLSGGEKQKIAIARADFKDAPVFVLDEPTSALDPIAEKKLYDNLNTVIGDKMMIIVSHRLQSVMLCDKILYIEKGRITECGTHEELMKNGKDYRRMFELQAQWYR